MTKVTEASSALYLYHHTLIQITAKPTEALYTDLCFIVAISKPPMLKQKSAETHGYQFTNL